MKVLKEVFKGFSIKKLLLSILCSIIVTTFMGFTFLFVTEVPSYTLVEILNGADGNLEGLKEIGSNMQEQYDTMEEHFAEQKEIYGEDYPVEGLFLYKLMNVSRSYSICKIYTLTLLIGIILGTLVYIIFIQKIKGVQMLLEAMICGIVILLMLILVNLGYNSIINMGINKIGASVENSEYITYVYDIDTSNILYMFIGIIGTSYIVNLIYQKILVNKFNKKLHKK